MHATLVGERTSGYAELGNVRPCLMPRTGVLWQVGSAFVIAERELRALLREADLEGMAPSCTQIGTSDHIGRSGS